MLKQRMLKKWIITGLMALSVTQYAGAAKVNMPEKYSDHDWDLICDNTLTCRAAGYSAEDVSPAASVLLTRPAGPGTPVTNRVILEEENAKPLPVKPVLMIDSHTLGELQVSPRDDGAIESIWQMDTEQFSAFTDALRHHKSVVFHTREQDYPFSPLGAVAVLQKMDEIQGRNGTPSALILSGTESESGVKAALPLPVVTRVTARENALRDMTAEEAARYREEFLPYISGNSRCQTEEVSKQWRWRMAQLGDNHTLISADCWRSYYDAGEVMLVVRNDKSAPPEQITDSGSWYEEGEIGVVLKGSQNGDCQSTEQYVWNGSTFVLRDRNESGRCLNIRLKGPWSLPYYEAAVIEPH